MENYLLTLACSKMNALKAFQLFNRTGNACHFISNVKLYDFIGCTTTCVRNTNGGSDVGMVVPRIAVGRGYARFMGTQLQRTILKGGITQAISKRIEGAIAYIQEVAGIFGKSRIVIGYRTSCILVIVIKRFLTCSLGQRGGKLATGHLSPKPHHRWHRQPQNRQTIHS